MIAYMEDIKKGADIKITLPEEPAATKTDDKEKEAVK